MWFHFHLDRRCVSTEYLVHCTHSKNKAQSGYTVHRTSYMEEITFETIKSTKNGAEYQVHRTKYKCQTCSTMHREKDLSASITKYKEQRSHRGCLRKKRSRTAWRCFAWEVQSTRCKAQRPKYKALYRKGWLIMRVGEFRNKNENGHQRDTSGATGRKSSSSRNSSGHGTRFPSLPITCSQPPIQRTKCKNKTDSAWYELHSTSPLVHGASYMHGAWYIASCLVMGFVLELSLRASWASRRTGHVTVYERSGFAARSLVVRSTSNRVPFRCSWPTGQRDTNVGNYLRRVLWVLAPPWLAKELRSMHKIIKQKVHLQISCRLRRFGLASVLER